MQNSFVIGSKNKNYSLNGILFMLFFYLFVFQDPIQKSVFSFFSNFDEFFAIIALPLGILALIKQGFKIKFTKSSVFIVCSTVLFLLVGFLSSYVYKYQQTNIVILDAFLCIKFWLAIYTSYYLFKSIDIKKYSENLVYHFIFLIVVFFLIDVFEQFTGSFSYIEVKLGFKNSGTIFSHPSVFNSVIVFLIAVYFTIRENIKSKKLKIYGDICFFVAFFIIITNGRSVGFGTMFIAIIAFVWVICMKKNINIIGLICSIPIVFLLGREKINFYFFGSDNDHSARYQLLDKAFPIAKDSFPFGSGFGTYGTYFSGEYYSPMYFKYGLDKVWGISTGFHGYISDVFWPAIIGQTGYFGLVFYCCMIGWMIYKVFGLRKVSKGAFAAGLIMVAYILIASNAGSAFLHYVTMPFAFWLGVLLNQFRYKDGVEKND